MAGFLLLSSPESPDFTLSLTHTALNFLSQPPFLDLLLQKGWTETRGGQHMDQRTFIKIFCRVCDHLRTSNVRELGGGRREEILRFWSGGQPWTTVDHLGHKHTQTNTHRPVTTWEGRTDLTEINDFV